jgi:ATP-dependent RNA helicase RhlE
MGFIHDIKKIIAKLPEKRQSLFFSATMPQAISELSDQILNQPKRVKIAPEQTTAEKVSQSVYFVSKADKNDLLKHVVTENPGASILVFSRTKHGADKVVKALHKSNIKSEAIHGNKSQNARQKTLQYFKKNKFSVLVATDIAARGIDVSKLSLVINYDLPNVPETYIHRIGRTGRAQEIGEAVSFCSNAEKRYLVDIQKLINQKIPVISDHPFSNPKDGGEFDTKKDKKTKNRSRSSSSTPKVSKKNTGSFKGKLKKNSKRKSKFKKSSKRKKG